MTSTKIPALKLTPKQDNVVILPDPVPDKTEADDELALPDTAKKAPPATGVVIAAGPGKNGVSMQSIPGEHVLYTRVMATPIELQDGKLYHVIEDRWVIGGLE